MIFMPTPFGQRPPQTCRRCSLCSINFPPGIAKCRKCGEITDPLDCPPDDEATIAFKMEHEPPSKKVTPRAWRFSEFLRLGLDWTQAGDAADSKIDLTHFRDLRAQECPANIAYDILR